MQIKEDKYFIFDRAKDVNLKYILKIFLSRILGFYYKLLMYFLRPQDNRKNKYNVSICAIFKNESKYIKEWIEFHKIVGIEHFYMYNNFSEDDYKSVLNSYINEGIVTLIEWPKKQGQIEAYHDCIKRFSLETKWLGFIDLDEFIVPNTNITIKGFIDKIISFNKDGITYNALIDYKTGNPDISIKNLKYGLGMQLPFYLYLLLNSDDKNKVVGFYLQKLMAYNLHVKPGESLEESKKASLKLEGYTTNDEDILKHLDRSYENSELIKNLKVTKNGFYRFAKIVTS